MEINSITKDVSILRYSTIENVEEIVALVQKTAEVLLAKSIARKAHRNQVYLPEHINYFFHLHRVAQIICLIYDGKFDLVDALVLSYLHDVVEDTDTRLDDLSIYYSDRIIKGVSALTKTNPFQSVLKLRTQSIE